MPATPKGNPIQGSRCDPKGPTIGVGKGPGRAAVMVVRKKGKKK